MAPLFVELMPVDGKCPQMCAWDPCVMARHWPLSVFPVRGRAGPQGSLWFSHPLLVVFRNRGHQGSGECAGGALNASDSYGGSLHPGTSVFT